MSFNICIFHKNRLTLINLFCNFLIQSCTGRSSSLFTLHGCDQTHVVKIQRHFKSGSFLKCINQFIITGNQHFTFGNTSCQILLIVTFIQIAVCFIQRGCYDLKRFFYLIFQSGL